MVAGEAAATAAGRIVPDKREDVVLGHPSGDAGAGNLRNVDVVFLRDLPDDWRRSLTDLIVTVDRICHNRNRRRGCRSGRLMPT